MIAAAAGAAAFAVVIAMAHDAGAQNHEAQPRVDTLMERLEDRHTLFAARVEQLPDDNLIERGRLVAMGGSRQGGAGMACISCHGADGAGDGSGAFPRLAGLPGWYMYKQLVDYASGARPNAIMSGVAERLTEYEMEAVSAYYALVEAPYPPVAPALDPMDLQWGGQLAAVGSAELGIPACVNCHGPMGTGAPPSVPYLAGQYGTYIALQLQLWKEGVRDNDAMNVMSAIADKMSEEDMRAVGAYYERARPAPALEVDVQLEAEADDPLNLALEGVTR
jgi:cytochrome c553